MKIAVIINHSSTGGYRYTSSLLIALKKFCNVDIDLFSSFITTEIEKLKENGINIYHTSVIRPLKINHRANPVKQFIKKIINILTACILNNCQKRLIMKFEKKYDLILYPWPYHTSPLDIKLPMFFVPHDFTFSHFFGLGPHNFFNSEYFQNVFYLLKSYFENGHAIVSSHFVKNEMLLYFPTDENNIDVVYLSKLNNYNIPSNIEIKSVLNKYKITNNYILWASNGMLHKNNGQMIGAYYYIKQKYPNIKLVMSGFGTEKLFLKSNTHYYADYIMDENEWDIIGLGELSGDDFAAVLHGAMVVVNTSLCEAGNGSGLDAWSIGIPVAQSNIPSFNEQLKFLDVKAEVFDPRNDMSIANAILKLLDNTDLAKKNANISKKAMENYTWKNIAEQYYNIFEKNTFTRISNINDHIFFMLIKNENYTFWERMIVRLNKKVQK